MTVILDGKKLRDKIFEKLSAEVSLMPIKPTLAVIHAGDDSSSRIYVNNKKKCAQKIGINSVVIDYPSNVSENEILKKIDQLNNDENITAILVQLPLPSHINKFRVIDKILPIKDVDGLTTYNSGKLFMGEEPYVYPCTPKGILLLLDEYNIETEGKHAVVIGRSNLVGKPISQMLLRRNATVTICHSKTKNLAEITKTADILISAVGKNIVGEKNIKSDCVVIDVGIFRDDFGKIRGDIEFDKVFKHVSYISPVPGGIGPMTITSLMLNTVELYNMQR